jgi:tyrosyl-tRNA synthetase
VAQRPEQREAQRRLASEMTRMVHDETALQCAEQASRVLFGGEVAGLSAAEVADIFADVPSGEIPLSRFQGEGLPVADLLTECGLVSSKGEARRAIEAGGIYLNNRRVGETALKVTPAEIIDGQFLVLRRGRKNYWLVRIGG